MKLSNNEAKLTSFWARNSATNKEVLVLKFAFQFGPKKLLGLSRKWPQASHLVTKSLGTLMCKASMQ